MSLTTDRKNSIFSSLLQLLSVFFLLCAVIIGNCYCYKRPRFVEKTMKKTFLCKASLDEYKIRCSKLSQCLKLNEKHYTCNDRNVFKVPGLPQNISTLLLQPYEFKNNTFSQDLPVDTRSLQVILNTTWNGRYLSEEKMWFDLRGIQRLENLVKLVLTQCPRPYYQPFALNFNRSTFQRLKRIKVLHINLDLAHDIALKEIVGPLTSLEVLDLSMSKGLNQELLRRVFSVMNRHRLQHLCLIRFQTIAMKRYNSSWDSKHIFYGLPFPYLKTLDLALNSIAKLSPGLAVAMPSLASLSVSDNMCMNYFSGAAIAEAILHKKLVYLDGSFQFGNKNQGSIFYVKYYMEAAHDIFVQKLVKCVNAYSNGNFTTVFTHRSLSYELAVCMYPAIFRDVERFLMPPLSEVVNANCAYLIQFPIKAKGIYLDSLNWMSSTGSIGLRGSICVKQNKLKVLSIGNNRDIFHDFFLSIVGNKKYTSDIIETFNVKDNGMTNDPMSFFENGKQYPKLTYFDLSGNNITFHCSVELCKVLPNVRYVDFSGNPIANDGKSDVLFLTNCSKLENAQLSNTGISATYNFNFTGDLRLKTVNLSHNNLVDASAPIFSSLETLAVKRNDTISIDLTGNPLNCNCSSDLIQQIRRLVSEQHLQMANFHEYRCYGATGLLKVENLTNNNDYFLQSRSSCPNIGLLIGVGCSAGIFGSCIFIAVGTLLVKKRWHLKYLLFRLMQKCGHRPADSPVGRWEYDAFVSYCAEDRFWVHDVLTKTLEQRYHFRLCIHYRDFRVGRHIAGEIVNRMEQSRECIVVLSDYFFRSQWCSFEMNHALLQADRRNSPVIIIRLGPISVRNVEEARVLDVHNYLEWNDDKGAQDLFWARLIGAMYGEGIAGACGCFCHIHRPLPGYQPIE